MARTPVNCTQASPCNDGVPSDASRPSAALVHLKEHGDETMEHEIAMKAFESALERLRSSWRAAAALDECQLLRAQIEDAADALHAARRELTVQLCR